MAKDPLPILLGHAPAKGPVLVGSCVQVVIPQKVAAGRELLRTVLTCATVARQERQARPTNRKDVARKVPESSQGTIHQGRVPVRFHHVVGNKDVVSNDVPSSTLEGRDAVRIEIQRGTPCLRHLVLFTHYTGAGIVKVGAEAAQPVRPHTTDSVVVDVYRECGGVGQRSVHCPPVRYRLVDVIVERQRSKVVKVRIRNLVGWEWDPQQRVIGTVLAKLGNEKQVRSLCSMNR